MDLHKRLDNGIARLSLLLSSFYIAWSNGTLPLQAMSYYASDWGGFIRTIDKGWETIGQPGYAADERHHADIWEMFAQALGTTSRCDPTIPALVALRDTANRLFADPITALGALYAFEAQQPDTSASKLKGLQEHYRLNGNAEEYFALHANDFSEAKWLRGRINRLDRLQFSRCEAACEEMCTALLNGLDALYPVAVAA